LNFAEADLECALPKLAKFGSEIASFVGRLAQ